MAQGLYTIFLLNLYLSLSHADGLYSSFPCRVGFLMGFGDLFGEAHEDMDAGNWNETMIHKAQLNHDSDGRSRGIKQK